MCTENYVTQEQPSEISRPQQLMQPAVTLDPEGKALNRRYRSCRAGISRPCTSGKGQWILCEGTVRALHSFSGFVTVLVWELHPTVLRAYSWFLLWHHHFWWIRGTIYGAGGQTQLGCGSTLPTVLSLLRQSLCRSHFPAKCLLTFL